MISVIIPFQEVNSYLFEAIYSLKVSLENFNHEIILIHNSLQRLSDANRGRIIAIDNVRILHEKRLGISYALNTGIKECNGNYIMRMDSDDICTFDRVKKSLDFLDKNHEYSAVGTAVMCIDEFGNVIKKKSMPKSPDLKKLRRNLAVENPVIHPTVLFRSSVFQKVAYCTISSGFEDYKLWLDMVNNNLLIGNIPDIGLYYRLHPNQVTRKDNLYLNDDFISFLKEVGGRNYKWYRKNTLNKDLSDYLWKFMQILSLRNTGFQLVNHLKQLFR